MSGWHKGYVWVNGHLLGRYWSLGPQQRLYCPAEWLKQGKNEVFVLDTHRTEPAPIRGCTERNTEVLKETENANNAW
jgi:beta-galactosidase